LFTGVRGRIILRTSALRRSTKFPYVAFSEGGRMVVIAPIVASSTMRRQMPEDPNKESTQNTAVTLHYIDKLFAARSASLAAAQRLSLSALVLSIVLLSLRRRSRLRGGAHRCGAKSQSTADRISNRWSCYRCYFPGREPPDLVSGCDPMATRNS